LRFAYAPFKKSDLNALRVLHLHELDVDPMLKIMVLPDLRAFSLPADGEFVHKNREMRIAHRDRNPSNLPERNFDRKFVSDLGFSHGGFKLEAHIRVRDQGACLDTCPGANRHFFTRIIRAKVSRNATRAIAGNLSFPTVGIQETRADVRVLRRK